MKLLDPQLQSFISVAAHKTVHAASRHLHVTQTAVTQRIRSLESRLRTTLFIRTRRGMTLTPEGQALLRYCQAVQSLEGEVLAKITKAAVETEIPITITGPTSIMESRVIPQVLPLLDRYPKLLMTFDINDIENRTQSLRAGESQFAILQKEQVEPEMKFKNLRSERYLLVCCKAWRHRKLKDILMNERIVDYDKTDQMTFNYLRHYQLLKFANHERHFANRTGALFKLIAAGVGYSVLTVEFSQPYLDSGALIALNHRKIFEHAIALAWYDRPEPPPYFSDLIKAIS